MQYGVCGDHVMAGAARQTGFTYMECTVGGMLKPKEDRAAFLAALAQARSGGLPIEVCNGFIPGDLKITGPAANLPALEVYIRTAFQRAHLHRGPNSRPACRPSHSAGLDERDGTLLARMTGW